MKVVNMVALSFLYIRSSLIIYVFVGNLAFFVFRLSILRMPRSQVNNTLTISIEFLVGVCCWAFQGHVLTVILPEVNWTSEYVDQADLSEIEQYCLCLQCSRSVSGITSA